MARHSPSRWQHRFVAASAGWLVLWRLAVVAALPHRTAVALALFGFVFHVLFGMGYLLLPSYFERELAVPRAPAVHLPLALAGTAALAVAPWSDVVGGVSGEVGADAAAALELGGAVAWCLGVALFAGSVLWTVRGNLTGRETGTADARDEHRSVDRFANAFVPVALGYLVVGSYELLANASRLPGITDGYPPRIVHLLAAGCVALLLFAVGVRLAPRFLGEPAPAWLVGLVLPAGAVGPALLAVGIGGGSALPGSVGLPADVVVLVGGAAESTAVLGFGVLYALLFVRSDRRRIGAFGVLGGVVAGALGVLVGLSTVVDALPAAPIGVHPELMLLGFLGLSIAGFALQFFPPSAGRIPGAGDRAAAAALLALGAGLSLLVAGGVLDLPAVGELGDAVALVGALGYCYLLVGVVFRVGAGRSR